MNVSTQIAKHLREVYFGGNWTDSNLKDNLEGLSWREATTQVYSLNTIATLVFHMNYYVSGVLKVLQGGPLETKDKYAFTHPPIQSQEDWEAFLEQVWNDAENFAHHIEQLPDHILREDFIDSKYGSYYRNLHGIIEHLHYHLGQVSLIRKIIQQQSKNN